MRNEKFGKMEKVSDNPLTVKYTINDGVKWSDGTPVTAADLVLQWAAFSGYYDDADAEAKTGTSYFSYAGDPTGIALTDFPELGEDGRSMTLKYSKPFADWEIAIGGPGIDIPAHVLAKKAGLADAKAFVDLVKGMPRGDAKAPQPANAQLQAMADMWNTGFDSKTLPADPSLYLSNGPYIVKGVNQDQSLTMVKNKDYNWGPEAKLDEITVRYIGSAPAQVQALKNGEADIIAPQASADTRGAAQGPREPGRHGRGRQPALLRPHRPQLLRRVCREERPRSVHEERSRARTSSTRSSRSWIRRPKPLDSQLFVPAQALYADSVKENGSSAYQDVDIEGAKKLLNGATPEVRIMYNKDNPNRADAYALISESATKAGFKIVDGGLGKSDWGKALGDGSYDATIFGWINSGVGVSGVPQIFKSGNDSNFNRFSDPEADKLMDELIVTTDKAKQDELIKQIDKKIWASAYGLPLFQSVGVDAYSDRITGVKYMPNQTGVWWNFWEWAQK